MARTRSSINPFEGGEVHANDVVSGTFKDGVVRTASPSELLEFDWWPTTDPDQSTSVTITLIPIESGTRVLITETVPPTSAGSMRASASMQWRGAMLSAALSSTRV